jgi:phage tail-like protein
MANGERVDPLRGYNFRVEIGPITNMGFRECAGLTFKTDPVEYREGSDRQLHVRKLYGLRTFDTIKLTRGIIGDRRLWEWYLQILNGAAPRRDGAVILTDEAPQPQWRWRFYEGFISQWEGPSFNATANEVAVEKIEICVERVEVV